MSVYQEKSKTRDEFSGDTAARIEHNAESIRRQQFCRKTRTIINGTCRRSCRKQLLGKKSVSSLNVTSY
jgi:hypothetical protein